MKAMFNVQQGQSICISMMHQRIQRQAVVMECLESVQYQQAKSI